MDDPCCRARTAGTDASGPARDSGLEQVLTLAARVLARDRHLASRMAHARESRVLAAFDGTPCADFLRYLIQVIGAETGRPATMDLR